MRSPEHGWQPTSAAYHPAPHGPRERYISVGQQGSHTGIGMPFGQLPSQIGYGEWRNVLRPLEQFLGFGPQAGSRRAGRMDQRLANATGPMADVLRNFRGFEAGILPQAENAGANVSAAGSAAFTTLQGQIDEALKNLPQFQREASAAGDYASRYATSAFSPVANEDLYQTALRRAEGAARPGMAAAGTLGTGAGDQAMQDIAANLAFQFGGLQNQQQQTAINQLGQTALGGANITAAGPQLAQGGLNAIPQFAQALSAQWGIPLETAGNILNLIMGGVGPATNILGATGPMALPSSSGYKFGIGTKS